MGCEHILELDCARKQTFFGVVFTKKTQTIDHHTTSNKENCNLKLLCNRYGQIHTRGLLELRHSSLHLPRGHAQLCQLFHIIIQHQYIQTQWQCLSLELWSKNDDGNVDGDNIEENNFCIKTIHARSWNNTRMVKSSKN